MIIPATGTPNNDNSPGSTNTLSNTITFGSVGFFDIEYIVTNSSGTTEYLTSETITNDTGIPWTDYHFELGFGTGRSFTPSGLFDFLDFDSPERDPAPTSSTFASLSHGANALNWSTGVQLSGSSQSLTFSLDIPDWSAEIPAGSEVRNQAGAIIGYRFTLRQYPTVPEPSSMLLIGTGLAALIRRRSPARQ